MRRADCDKLGDSRAGANVSALAPDVPRVSCDERRFTAQRVGHRGLAGFVR